MSILCGNCHEQHATSSDVRACYAAARPFQTSTHTEVANTAAYGKGASPIGPSEKQTAFLAKLLDERPVLRDVENLWPNVIAQLSRHEASELIDRLIKTPKEAQATPRPDVPEGRYALVAEDGHVVFYQVDKPTTGRWAGYVFIVMLLGSPGDFEEVKLNKAQQASTLDRIAVNPAEAALRFSRKFTVCARCLSPLTQVRSRATGFGPVCSDHLGVVYLDRATSLRILDEQGISKEGLEDLEEVS